MYKSMLSGMVISVAALTGCTTLQSSAPTTTQTNNAIQLESTVKTSSSSFQADWVNALESLRPALRSCLIKHKTTRYIAYAVPMAQGSIVYLSDAQGQLQECFVNSGSGQVEKISLSQTQIPAHIPAFYPVGRQLGSHCQSVTPKRDQAGRMMGSVCLHQ